MKHSRTILASSIVAALVGVSGTAFAQTGESLHANATAASRVAMATGPESVPASAEPAYATYSSYEQTHSALARVEAETGPSLGAAQPVYAVAQVAAVPAAVTTDAQAPTETAIEPAESQLASADTADSAENAAMEQYAIAESRYDASTSPALALAMTDAPSSLPLDEDETGLAEVAMVDSRANAAANANDAVTPAESADAAATPATAETADPAAADVMPADAVVSGPAPVTEPYALPAADAPRAAFEPPLRTDTAAPTSTSTPVTGNFDAPPSMPLDDIDAVDAPSTRSEYE